MKKFLLLICVSISLLSPCFAATVSDNVYLRIEPEQFSPNGDGVEDDTFISPVLRTESDVTRWRLEINSGRKMVARLSGSEFSALIKWSGLDRKGKILKDGTYSAVMTVWGSNSKYRSQAQRIIIDTAKPIVSIVPSRAEVTATILTGDPLTLKPSAQDDFDLERWQVQVLNERGQTVKLYWSSGPVVDVMWDGRDENTEVIVPRGKYTCVFQAWDKAGNESDPTFGDFFVNVSPREMLQGALRSIHVFETPLGLIVQLSKEKLFMKKSKKPVLRPGAAEELNQVSLLLNAYVDKAVRVDGYSSGLKKFEEDRSLSSLYAWNVYSYLVKQGQVTASRLTVHGRGRSPVFERQSVTPAPLQNGVEVLVLGDGPW